MLARKPVAVPDPAATEDNLPLGTQVLQLPATLLMWSLVLARRQEQTERRAKGSTFITARRDGGRAKELCN